MITVHILEANLKVLPGKITLLVTEPLTHSLPHPSKLQSSQGQRERGEGTLLALKTHSKRTDIKSEWQDKCTLLGKATVAH